MRRPVHLLNGLLRRLAEAGTLDGPLKAAAWEAHKEIKQLRDQHPAYTPPRPSYYGLKGGTRNPFYSSKP